MAEQGNNDVIFQRDEEIANVSDDFVPEDAWPVCPKYFQPCNPLQNYCNNCDSNETINPLASYMPFVRIRFTTGMFGKIWRRILDGRDTPIALTLFFLIPLVMGAPIILFVGLPLLMISKIKNARLQKTNNLHI